MKVHIAVNVKTQQIVALEVTREYIHDGTRLEGLVEESSRRVDVKGVIGDGAYDSRRNFNLLDERGIEPIIRVRRNAVKRLRGCPAKRKALIMQRENPDVWKCKYGLRWIAESAFLWLKRAFGEYVTTKNLKNMIQEITLKVFLYNLFIGMTRITQEREEQQRQNRRHHKNIYATKHFDEVWLSLLVCSRSR